MIELEGSWFETEEWRGFVLTAPRAWLLSRHIFVTWLAGSHYHADAIQDPGFAPESRLLIRPEPDNPFDPHALAVCNAAGTVEVGYIPHVVASRLDPSPTPRRGLVLSELRSGGRRVGLGILLSREEVALRPSEVPDEWLARVGRRLMAQAKKVAAWEGVPNPPSDPVEQMVEELRRRHEDGKDGVAPGS